MRVTFVAVGYEQLPVSLLASIAKRDGHEVGLAFSAALFADRYHLDLPWLAALLDDRNSVLDTIEAQRPHLLAFSSLTNNHAWMLGVAREAKQRLPGLKVVFGGCHPSAAPEACLEREEIDYVCVGEGEVALPRLLRALEAGNASEPLPNIRFRDRHGGIVRGPQLPFVKDLDALPFFEKELWEDYIRVGDHYMTMASRGCPYRCTFCFNNSFSRLPDAGRGNYVRRRSVDHMMAELLEAKRRYHLRFVDFEDDIFTMDKVWLHAFLDRYQHEIHRPFQCLTHARFVDRDVAAWLRDAGCEVVQMGVQSADASYRKHRLRRNEDDDQLVRAIDALNESGIKLKLDHIFGLPGEPFAAQETARKLYASHTPARIDTFWATYLPGTEMAAQAHELGILTDADLREIEGGHLHGYHSGGHASPDQLRAYLGYDLLFCVLPLVPARLRGRIEARTFGRLPLPLARGARFTIDMANALRTRSNEHLAYGLHYLYHIGRITADRLKLQPPPATRARS